MIKQCAKLSIRVVPIECIQVKEYQVRYVDQLLSYIQLLKDHPKEYAGLVYLVPSDTHAGMFALYDGHTRFCANIMAGRRNVLAVVEEEEETTTSVPFEEWHDEAIRERIPHVGPRTDYRRYREMGHNQVGALLMVIENLVHSQEAENE